MILALLACLALAEPGPPPEVGLDGSGSVVAPAPLTADPRLEALDGWAERLSTGPPAQRAVALEHLRSRLAELEAREEALRDELVAALSPAARTATLDALLATAEEAALVRLRLAVAGAPATSASLPAEDLLRVGGQLVVPSGSVVRDAIGLGADVRVMGTVLRHAVSLGGQLHVGGTGSVGGEAVALGGDVAVDPGGRVAGHGGPLAGSPAAGALLVDGPLPLGRLALRLVPALLAAALVLLLRAWRPARVERAARALVERPVASLAAGGLLVGVVPAVLPSLLGHAPTVPLAALLGGTLLAAWAFGFGALVQIGSERLVPSAAGPVPAVVGTVGVLTLGAVLPWVGPMVLLVLAGAAMGGTAVSLVPARA
ncbi:MAG: hypothetical protein H6732_15510 [Alphaproteobacteria bacterium]|nr:hypothetical protein [Alphaproteobacteria bacterium]